LFKEVEFEKFSVFNDVEFVPSFPSSEEVHCELKYGINGFSIPTATED
jgi:hypothetical protein